MLARLPRWESTCPFSFAELTEFYRTHGAGLFARHRAFLWEDGVLCPVEEPDCPEPDELFGYELQRDQVEANTRALLAGSQVNNVLLYGDAGTGKSSTVKAVVNEYAGRGLKIIEMSPRHITCFPRLFAETLRSPFRFIVFLDDLSFNREDDNFAALKAFIEGGLAGKPSNLVIYATSNRRHLIKETLTDREGDDVHESDTRQELMSLSARFGLTVTFGSPDRERYLHIVEELAKQYGVELDPRQLAVRSEAFAVRSGGRSARVAKQFIELCKAGVFN